MLGTSGGIKFVILVEDSDTGGPSLIIVRLEYLLCNSDVVNLVWESNKGRQEALFLIFVIWGCFDRRCVRDGGAEQKASVGLSKILLYNSSGGKILLRASAGYNKLLGRLEFRILPNIHDGAPPRKQPTALRH